MADSHNEPDGPEKIVPLGYCPPPARAKNTMSRLACTLLAFCAAISAVTFSIFGVMTAFGNNPLVSVRNPNESMLIRVYATTVYLAVGALSILMVIVFLRKMTKRCVPAEPRH
jgi:hypothetical protein